MSTIYIAAPFQNRDDARKKRDFLVGKGHVVTSRWIDTPFQGDDTLTPEQRVAEARMDLEDISRADVFVVLTDPRPIGVGHHVEFGYALAIGLEMVVIGPSKSIFHDLATRYETWEEALEAIG